MLELVEYIVKSLVVDKDSVKITMNEENDETVIHVFVDAQDMGRIIGKSGKIASSIRTIVKSLSAREHKKVYVKFGE